MIEDFAKYIPESLHNKSGSVFYSGRNAFADSAEIYMLGLNPGGDPELQAGETIERHTHKVLHHLPDDWSAYRDESWKARPPGTWRMQPRVLHLIKQLGLSAGEVPASNVIFQRSRREKDIKHETQNLMNKCWPFHQTVIDTLNPKAIICFGKTAGGYVRKQIGAKKQIDEFIETNNRKWRNRAFQNPHGRKVIVLTHPSIADWCAPDTDPSNMVLRAIND